MGEIFKNSLTPGKITVILLWLVAAITSTVFYATENSTATLVLMVIFWTLFVHTIYFFYAFNIIAYVISMFKNTF